MSIFDKLFKKKNEITPYDKTEIVPRGNAWIESEDFEKLKNTPVIKKDTRESDPHIRGLKPITRDEADEQLSHIRESGENCIKIGGVSIPDKSFTKHCLVTGQNGSGKTTLLKKIMAQTLSEIGEGKDQRAIIYDPKNDFVPFLYGLLGNNAPIKILNPFDARCFAWDIGKDVINRAQAATVAKIFVPDPKGNSDDNQFFRDGARTLIRTVQESFILTSLSLTDEGKIPLNWTLRDLCLALRETNILREVLSRHDETKHALEFLDRSNNEILVTAKAYLSEIEIIAAAWEGKEKFSLRDFRDNKNGMVLVLGSYREANSPLQALNSVILQRSIQMLLTDSETRTRRSWIYLDEFTSLGKIDDFHTILQEGRSKGVCNVLSFQNIETVRHLYSKEIANAIASECATKIFLKCEGEQAAWVADFLGKREVWRMEDSTGKTESFGTNQGTSQTFGGSSGTTTQGLGNTSYTNSTSWSDTTSKGTSNNSGTTKTKNWRIKEEPVVTQGDLKMIPEAGEKNGIAGIYLTSAVQGVWTHRNEWHELTPYLNITSAERKFISRDDDARYQYLKNWTNDERIKFGLSRRLPTKDELQSAILNAKADNVNEQ